MQDRFKFRAWNTIVERFQYFDFKELSKMDYENIQWHILKFQQCTGLRDKNGRLIYEGDVVKYTDEVYDCCIGKIEWDNAHYELQYYTDEKYGWFSHILCLKYIKNIEVIGNIYENPELLESDEEK